MDILEEFFKQMDLPEEKEDDFDDPQGSEWILGVDAWKQVFIIKAPNIHPGFLEPNNAEEIGLPYDAEDKEPGVYKVITAFEKSYSGEYGMDEDYYFNPTSWEPLYPIVTKNV